MYEHQAGDPASTDARSPPGTPNSSAKPAFGLQRLSGELAVEILGQSGEPAVEFLGQSGEPPVDFRGQKDSSVQLVILVAEDKKSRTGPPVVLFSSFEAAAAVPWKHHEAAVGGQNRLLAELRLAADESCYYSAVPLQCGSPTVW